MNDRWRWLRVGGFGPRCWRARWGPTSLAAAALLLTVWGAHRLATVSAADRAAAPGTSVIGPEESTSHPSVLARQVGIERLDRELGAQAPTGRGIVVGHVEGGDPGDYTPDLQDSAFSGVAMTPMTGPSKISGHATATARILYGPHGLAPGVGEVKLWPARAWFGSGALRVGSAEAPTAQGCRLFNHSWIAPANAFSSMTLTRVDYLIDHDDVVMVAGINNGAGTPIPALLASAYNAIAVGLADGQSSGGYTTTDGVGRCKPEVVAPGDKTSFSTPAVTAVCARLLEQADRLGVSFPQARRSAVIKAVLLAGAEKPAGWAPRPGKPLDEHLGAGSVRCDQSLAIFRAGPCPPGPLTAPCGWDFHPLGLGATAGYDFAVAKPTGEISIMLVWNRRIAGPRFDEVTGQMIWDDRATLAHFDLALVRVGGRGGGQTVAFSASPIDNLQHLYLKSLPPGRYRFGVRRHDDLDQDWSYALAWRIEDATLAPVTTQPQDPAER